MTGPLVRILVAASLMVSLILFVPGFAAAGSSAQLGGGCYYDRPSRLPYWTVSGVWDDGELLLVDAAANEIIRYSAEGRALGVLKGLDSGVLGPLRPSQIANADGGMVLQLTEGRFVFLGADWTIRAQRDVFRESRPSGGRIDAVRLWAVAGDDLVLCGDAVRGENDWRLGFFRAPLADPSSFEPLVEFEGPGDPAELFCRLGLPYITKLGDTAYFLIMGETPAIYSVEGGEVQRLEGAKLPPRPDLPGLVTRGDFPTVYRAVVRSHMAAGLFASEGRLFVLIREPRIAGTRWTLHEIDPETGRELGEAVVPSVVDHLLVVPGTGTGDWAFVEKGEVREMGVQDVEGVLRVPAENVRAIRSLGEGADLCGRGSMAQSIAAANH